MREPPGTGTLRVAILGGYGFFATQLTRMLDALPGMTIVIAGRSIDKAQAAAEALVSPAEAAHFDRDAPPEPQLAAIAPDLVIDAMGPFQDYGDDPYPVVRACLKLGIDYMDFADGAKFVAGIVRFDAEARAAGVLILSGVSSYPVLTAAVTRHLAAPMARVESIAGGIAPASYAGVGLSVVRAISAYGGKAVPVLRASSPGTGWGLIDSWRFTIAPPGCLPLPPIRFSLVDVPEYQVLPEEWPDLREIWLGAGPRPASLHWGLTGLAWLVRLRLLPSLAPLAPLFHWAARHLRWGEPRGGMFIEVSGRDSAGGEVTRSWHLLAEGDDGPLIPAMALAALVERISTGRAPEPGARAALHEVELADYERQFAGRRITAGVRESIPAGAPLYRRILGSAFDSLPEPVRRMHEVDGTLVAEGRAEVTRGRNPMARVIAALFGFPGEGRDVPVRVSFTVKDGVERWERSFAGRRFGSWQSMGEGPWAHLLAERFGPFVFGLALLVDEGRMRLVPRRWTAFGLPMPRWLMPGGESYETEQDGRFRFHVEIRLPLIGLVVCYRGWLVPDICA